MTIIRTIVFISTYLIFVSHGVLYAESKNYCHDKGSWKEWDRLIEKNPNDTELQTFHALRLGLCLKVEAGGITLERATEIFESARAVIIKKGKEDQKREQDRQKL